MKKIVLAIDGYSACGKSTTAKAVAIILGYTYIDSGAMYRAVTLYFHQHHVSLTNKKDIIKALANIDITFHPNEKTGVAETFLNGLNVENEIRKMYISENVSQVSSIVEVREAMVAQQKKLGKKKGVVMDGRDIGTVVFPDAELKIFMQADIYVRAGRRQAELLEREQLIDLGVIIENLKKRDHIDSTREVSPLRKATDAVTLDTTFLTFEEQVDEVVSLAVTKILADEKQSIDA
ncbi:Cytidylate kinase [Fulvivirga imtechensis AK7]|uniref:Cytidylate kinase n=1 Tax=Fulvivirga imtechensis AK7 TaxID=1237149 RepID=L8JSD1_9BACT|nr:(d)CMP kinase [Fulvivirga imtechensis]ELR71881.1 Cytidylate kinase [Fulvivirga imtechensis AK7]